ncbi:hypothetical protein [Paraburkholderia caledonica]|uniref:hypothetical protein n=1 Tax=Paraburkholderia caledonica TaxID=134536 RepID=UPI000B3F9E89|nr:hypothetical protein [Paraburkholderia caledonica]
MLPTVKQEQSGKPPHPSARFLFDDEHRGAIIDLILNPKEVGKRQLIVTTHGENFVKRLENAVPMKKYEETVTRIDFLVPFAAKKITVKLDSPRH